MGYIGLVPSFVPAQMLEDEPLRFQSAAYFDAPLRESRYFVCVPSLGSMVPGWVLISPKRPVLCMDELTSEEVEDFQAFFAELSSEVSRTFGPISAFEHGARSPGSATGCGVDQAHLHIVPINFQRLWAEVSASQVWYEQSLAVTHNASLPTREYLWVSNGSTAQIAYPTVPTSQFFRRAIARIIGAEAQWDYRNYPFHEHIAETRRVLSTAAEPPQSRAA